MYDSQILHACYTDVKFPSSSYQFSDCILQAWSVPEVLRPLYESSRVVAQKMTTAVSYCNLSISTVISDIP